jgi:putative Mg2+ transporter-C (MgtC) family protein
MDPLSDIISHWLSPLGWTGEAIVRLALAGILGGLVGLERELRGREAGFRTNLLVCVGSALVMLVSVRFAAYPWGRTNGNFNVNIDPARIAYGVMGGIGFLGAGAILKHGAGIRGLTTAAGLWCIAAIGLACGFGLYVLACATSGLVLIAVWGLYYLERIVPRQRYRMLTFRCPWQAGALKGLIDQIEAAGLHVVDQSFRREGDLSEVDLRLYVAFQKRFDYDSLIERLRTDGQCRLIASEGE